MQIKKKGKENVWTLNFGMNQFLNDQVILHLS